MTLSSALRPFFLTCFALGCSAVAQADIIATLPAIDGVFYDESSSFPPASIPLGTFTFTSIPTNAQILSVTISGTFGNLDFATSALADLFVRSGAIQVGACDIDSQSNYPDCFLGTSDGSLVSWSHTFTSSELTSLRPSFLAGSLDLTAVQNSFGSIDIGPSTLDISIGTAAPEPGSIFLLAGGAAALVAVRRRK